MLLIVNLWFLKCFLMIKYKFYNLFHNHEISDMDNKYCIEASKEMLSKCKQHKNYHLQNAYMLTCVRVTFISYSKWFSFATRMPTSIASLILSRFQVDLFKSSSHLLFKSWTFSLTSAEAKWWAAIICSPSCTKQLSETTIHFESSVRLYHVHQNSPLKIQINEFLLHCLVYKPRLQFIKTMVLIERWDLRYISKQFHHHLIVTQPYLSWTSVPVWFLLRFWMQDHCYCLFFYIA